MDSSGVSEGLLADSLQDCPPRQAMGRFASTGARKHA